MDLYKTGLTLSLFQSLKNNGYSNLELLFGLSLDVHRPNVPEELMNHRPELETSPRACKKSYEYI